MKPTENRDGLHGWHMGLAGGGSSGLTFTEVMIVIAIIAVLMAAAIPSLTKARLQSQTSKAEAELEMLAAAISQLAWDTGLWPGMIARNIQGDAETWDLTTEAAGILRADTSKYRNWQGPYIRDVPLDPWGSRYFFDPDYRIDNVNRAVVGSFGPNRVGPNKYDDDNLYVILK